MPVPDTKDQDIVPFVDLINNQMRLERVSANGRIDFCAQARGPWVLGQESKDGLKTAMISFSLRVPEHCCAFGPYMQNVFGGLV